MDKLRYIIIAALIVTTYLLILEWNKDYGQQSTITNNSLEKTTTSQQNTQKDIPLLTDTKTTHTDTLTTNTNKNTSSANIINVATDTLNINIDLVGGDIVKASLPKYPIEKDKPNEPFVLLNEDDNQIYVAESGLIGLNGPDANPSGRPTYKSSSNNYKLQETEQSLIVDLNLNQNDVSITKRFEFKRGEYQVKVSYIINNQSSQTWQGGVFAQIKRDNSKDPSSGGAKLSSYLGAAFFTDDSPYQTVNFKAIKNESFKTDVMGGWVAMIQHYFISAWVGDPQTTNNYYTRYQDHPFYMVGFTGPNISVAPKTNSTINLTFYAGPKIQSKLREISKGLDLTADYGHLWWIAQPLLWLMLQIHKVLGNWGFSIIGLTLIVRMCMYPISAAGYKSMAKMKKVAPELQRIKERYEDQRQRSQAMMELYKKEKINPFGGCLPLLIQMPMFYALIWALSECVELRQAPFIFWITDLSVKDPYFVLPILYGATMYFQQQLNPAPADPTQAKVMKLMPIMLTFIFLFFPSGMVLYWMASNLISILQQWMITRQIEAASK